MFSEIKAEVFTGHLRSKGGSGFVYFSLFWLTLVDVFRVYEVAAT